MAQNLGEFNAAPITIEDKNFAPLQVDANGALKVTPTGGGGGAAEVELAALSANSVHVRDTGAGSIPVDVTAYSVANIGGADGTFAGVTVPSGLVVSDSATANVTSFNTIAYDATGTEFYIIYQLPV